MTNGHFKMGAEGTPILSHPARHSFMDEHDGNKKIKLTLSTIFPLGF
jgi:hypothetical protein